VDDVTVSATAAERADEVLSTEALAFVAELQRRFGPRRDELLAGRAARRDEAARTRTLSFPVATRSVREDPDWRVAETPADLCDRRVEITGPTERKMAINALNSGARVWLADLEDANTPHWDNVVSGQVNLFDAVRRRIAHTSPEGKEYRLQGDELPTIVMRPRGWHLDERHLMVNGKAAVGALVDFGLYFFHNARVLLDRGSGPYFYLPKLESHLEARLWDEVFTHAQEALGIPHGTVRATVLIETITAAFEMEEILYELRDHASGLNAGRWDYLFSYIKTFRDAGEDFLLPDRNSVTMDAPFMRAYTDLLVRTCHRRGAIAMGGMAAFIPNRRDPSATESALAKVRSDKQREAGGGFDGSWVAHPDLVPICAEAFDEVLGTRPNQIARLREDVSVSPEDLLSLDGTPRTFSEEGLRNNVSVALQYLAAWLEGTGAVAINNLMEDAATAEIARSQVWQWIRNEVVLDTGAKVTHEMVGDVLREELARLREAEDALPEEHLARVATLFERVAMSDDFVDFLTLPAYDLITD
jgi:malate synthase